MQISRECLIGLLAVVLVGCGRSHKTTTAAIKPGPAMPVSTMPVSTGQMTAPAVAPTGPVAAIWFELGYPPPGAVASEKRRLIVGVWADGRVVWSDDRGKGGAPYREGQIEPRRVDELLRAIEAADFFNEKRTAFYGPDASHTVLAARNGEKKQQIGSWHEPASTRSNLVIDERGMHSLQPGEARPAPSAQYATFLREWSATRKLIEGVVPAEGEPLQSLDPSVFEVGR